MTLLTVPTIHLNGTHKDDLMEALNDAYIAICYAENTLARTTPNGRDYYPQGPDAIHAALTDHRRRMQKLADVKQEIDELREAIDKGGQ